MADCPNNQLLGYLLDALEEDERAAVEEEVARNPALKQKLALLRLRMEPLKAIPTEFDPPSGLAERTLQKIFSGPQTNLVAQSAAHLPAPVAPIAMHGTTLPTAIPLGASAGWRWPDLSMVAGLCVAAAVLIFPALERSRFHSQVVSCQNNLRELGQALVRYSQRHQDLFPQASPHGGVLASAGIYAPTLLDGGYVTNARLVVCPGSALAGDSEFRIPSFNELRRAAGRQLERLRRSMGGSYGYSLGYVADGRYFGPRNFSRPTFALMSDVPSELQPDHRSVNHGGQGQNVLFEDGHVSFLSTTQPDDAILDDVFINDNRLVAPGLHLHDSVIGSSEVTPASLDTTPAVLY